MIVLADRDQEQYLRSKLYSGMSKDSSHSHEDHLEPREDDLSATSDRSESEEEEQEEVIPETRQSSVSNEESEKSHG